MRYCNYINQLNTILTESGLTQTQLALKLGVTHATLSRWLHQKAKPQNSRKQQIVQLHKEIVGIQPLPEKEMEQIFREVEGYKIPDILSVIASCQDIRKELSLELTYNTTTIEGATFSRHETDAIMFDHSIISGKSQEEHLSVINHQQALDDILNGQYSTIDELTIKSIHKTIMHGIREDAGQYASQKRGIRGVNLVLPHPEDIPEEIERLIKRFNQKQMSVHLLEHFARYHADFEAIHPFGDGNGRVGRLLLNFQLLEHNYPPAIIENSRKADYYEALEYAQKQSITHLVKFLSEEIKLAYNLFKKYL